MKVLVLGATGATGRLVVQQLINRNIKVKIVVRKINDVIEKFITNGQLECLVGNISEYERSKMVELLDDCDAVVSCLGHNITFKGMFGKPRLLVTNCIRNVCEAIQENKKGRVKVILMNTTANWNRKIHEDYSLKDRIVLTLLRYLLPPQKDNEEAAKYLSSTIGENNSKIEWTAVRPDTLINEDEVSEYEFMKSPKRSPVFDAGKTSRINVAHFMTALLLNEELWEKWKYKMPVIYNSSLDK